MFTDVQANHQTNFFFFMIFAKKLKIKLISLSTDFMTLGTQQKPQQKTVCMYACPSGADWLSGRTARYANGKRSKCQMVRSATDGLKFPWDRAFESDLQHQEN